MFKELIGSMLAHRSIPNMLLIDQVVCMKEIKIVKDRWNKKTQTCKQDFNGLRG